MQVNRIEQEKNQEFCRYTPGSPLEKPATLVTEIVSDLWKSRELIRILFLRDLKSEFRQSYLGYFWLLAAPIMNTLVWLILNASNLVNIGDVGMPYPVFLLIGSVFWQSFANGVQQPLKSFHAGKPVFMKLKVPPEAFIVAGSARVIFDLLISLLLLVPVFVSYGITPPAIVILLPVVIAANYFLAAAIGVLFLPLGGLYSDIEQAIAMLLRFAMFFAPTVYAIPSSGWLTEIMAWNPVTPVLAAARDSLVLGSGDGWMAMALFMPLSAMFLVGGFVMLRVVMPHLVARMGM
jgi:lipopolysaccharide transport system permease protein